MKAVALFAAHPQRTASSRLGFTEMTREPEGLGEIA